MAKVSKDMIIADLINIDQYYSNSDESRYALHWLPSSAQGESLEEAAMVHGIDADMLVDQINDYLAQ